MNSPNILGGAAVAVEQSLAPVPQAGIRTAKSSPPDGKAHAVPVREVVGSSGWLAEAVYRVVEILIAVIGLTVGLPIMLIEAALIRLDSPGAVLFRHLRPARSVMRYGRDLEGQTDLLPPPGGYDPDALYYVPSYFRLVKFRTMYDDARSRFPELYTYDFAPGEFHRQYGTNAVDPRLTRIGKILRTLSIDELPNLSLIHI